MTAQKGKKFYLNGRFEYRQTSIGTAISQQLGLKLIDGDDLHPRANIIKMRDGHPLNDEDRAPLVERIRDAAFSLEQNLNEALLSVPL